jgi:multidrug efflux pump subunit AcrB
MRLHERPVVGFAILLAISVLLAFLCRGLKAGESAGSRYNAWTIRFEYFGIDAAEMEKLITIPLEAKLTGMSGLFEIRSTTEYGASNTSVFFALDTDAKKTYLTLRDIVDTLYASLPTAVQKPRIYSSSTDQKPAMTLAAQSDRMDVNELRRYVDSKLKPKIESLDGVAEVIVAGGSLEEIKIEFDTGKVVIGNVNPNALGSVVRDANVLSPGGKVRQKDGAGNFAFDMRIRKISEMRELPVAVKDGIAKLSFLATVRQGGRSQDEISRINEKEGVTIAVKTSSGGNSMTISKEVRAILASEKNANVAYTVLSDSGETARSMIRQVVIAIVQSFILVILILPFFFRSRKITGLIILCLPLSVFWTLAILNVAGFTIDQNVLSGMSIALGLIVDCALVVSEQAENSIDRPRFLQSLGAVVPSIVSSSATTVLVLVPLYFLESLVPGIRSVVVTIGVMVVASLVLSCVFLPCFIGPESKSFRLVSERVRRKIRRWYARASFFASRFCLDRKRMSLCVYAALALLPVVLFFVTGKDVSLVAENDVMGAYVEYESERSPESIDRELAAFIEAVRKEDGVRYVWSEARKGSMEFEVKYDADKYTRSEIARKVNGHARLAGSGFLYIPDLASSDRGRLSEIEIAVVGDDSGTCRKVAGDIARAGNGYPGVEQVVLNFKDNEREIRFRPDRAKLAKNGLSVASVANTLRWIMFGPVVDKWIEDGTEMDIRVSGSGFAGARLDNVGNIYIPTNTGGVRLNTLGSLERTTGIGKIYRKDGRRAAYLTMHVRAGSTDRAIAVVNDIISGVDIPRGYGVSLPKELERMKAHYATLVVAFAFAVAGIILLLTGLSEKPVEAFAIASIIPVSVSLPLLIRFVSGSALGMGDIVGMVVLSGVSVNNAIYIAESARSRTRDKVRNKVQSILVTSLTSVAGAVPLAILGKAGFSKDLSFFMIWGTLCSVVAAISLFPVLYECVARKGEKQER